MTRPMQRRHSRRFASFPIPGVRNRFPRFVLPFVSTALLLLSAPLGAAVVQFSNGSFSGGDWEVVIQTAGDGGDGSGMRVGSGGHFGAYWEVSITVADTQEGGESAFVAVFSINTGAVYDPSVSGAIDTLDYAEDSLFISSTGLVGGGQAAAPALRQGGKLFTLPVALTFATPDDTWTPHQVLGLTESDFRTVASPNEHPDFSIKGAPIELGFYRANSQPAGNISGTHVGGVDNWEITINQAEPFQINAGVNDAWLNFDTAGQGMFVVVFPALGKIFIAVFTFDTERPPEDVKAIFGDPGHRWFTAFGDFSADTAVLDVELTEGGVFDSPEPQVTQTPHYGTVTLRWVDCKTLIMTYALPGPGLAGEIEMIRVTNDNVALCEALAEADS